MKLKRVLIVFFTACYLLLSGYTLFAQITFQKIFGGVAGDYGYAVQQTSDSGYAIAGATASFAGGFVNVYLIKTNIYGDTLWTKTFGGVQNDRAYSIQQTTDGGYVIAGRTESFGAGGDDFYLIKTDPNGDMLWSKTFGGNGLDWAKSVQQTNDGGYIIAGYTYSYGVGNSDAYIIKTDSNGDTLWTRTYGGTNYDIATSVLTTNDGGYILTGYTGSFSVGSLDVFLLHIDSMGNHIWMKTYGDPEEDVPYFFQQTIDGGYIITGHSELNDSLNILLLKTDSIGDALWTKTYVGLNVADIGECVRQTSDSGYIVVGFTAFGGANSSDLYLLKINSFGNILWTRTYDGLDDEVGYSVQETNDHGYIIAGSTGSFGASSLDVYLIKADSMGNSGCNLSNYQTLEDTPIFIITAPVPLISSGGTVTAPPTIVGFGSTVVTVCSNVGIDELTDEIPVMIFPNPVTSQIFINYSLEQNKTGLLEIINTTGQVIFKKTLPQWSSYQQLNLPELSEGVYLMKLKSGEKMATVKFVKMEE